MLACSVFSEASCLGPQMAIFLLRPHMAFPLGKFGGRALVPLSHLIKTSVLLDSSHSWSQFSSVAQSCLTLCNPMDCSTPGLPVHHQLPDTTQTHLHQVGDAIQPSHPLSPPSPPSLNLSQHQGLFQWVSSSHQVDKLLELQLQHLFFQWIFRTDFL